MNNVELTYGYKDSRLYHVKSVENGLLCNCVCYKCGATLIAKNNKNNVKAPHFAHYKADECKGGVETALHKMAIQLIVDNKVISTPDFIKTPSEKDMKGNVHYGKEINFPSINVKFDEVHPEFTRDGYRVDATGITHDEMIHVEIRVTHGVDEEKKEKVRKKGETMFEIDLRGLSSDILIDEVAFRNAVLHDIEIRSWISHPEYFALFDSERKKLTAQVNEINLHKYKKEQEHLEKIARDKKIQNKENRNILSKLNVIK